MAPAPTNRSRNTLRLASFAILLASSLIPARPSLAGPAAGPLQLARPEDAPEHPSWLERNEPEWMAMLREILAGHQPDPGTGWFKRGVARTRFDWKSVSDRLDTDRDGRITRAEYGPDATGFARLDRTRDGQLDPADFSFRTAADSSSQPDDALSAFLASDANANGRVNRHEFETFWGMAQADPVYRILLAEPGEMLEARLQDGEESRVGYLSLSDFQDAFSLSSRAGGRLSRRGRPRPARPIPKEVLLGSFLRQELGAWGPGPELGQPAPDFTLARLEGGKPVSLSERIGPRPVVLIFASYSCHLFRSHGGSLAKLRAIYKDDADFVMVYTKEAHPTDGWQTPQNVQSGVAIPQASGMEERLGTAEVCRKTLALDLTLLVDGMDNRVGRLYSGLPSRLYLIGRDGRIAYKSGRGPFGFKPAELEQLLILMRRLDAAPAR